MFKTKNLQNFEQYYIRNVKGQNNFETEYFLNLLLLDISQIWYIGIFLNIKMPIGANNLNVETYRKKVRKYIYFHQKTSQQNLPRIVIFVFWVLRILYEISKYVSCEILANWDVQKRPTVIFVSPKDPSRQKTEKFEKSRTSKFIM